MLSTTAAISTNYGICHLNIPTRIRRRSSALHAGDLIEDTLDEGADLLDLARTVQRKSEVMYVWYTCTILSGHPLNTKLFLISHL